MATDKIPDLAEQARHQGKQAVHGAASQADRVIDKAADAAHSAHGSATGGAAAGYVDKAKDLASTAYDAAKGYVSAAGEKLSDAADAVRSRIPTEGRLGTAASAVADTFDRGRDYLSQKGLGGVGDDLTDMVRKHPLPALLIGVGIGYLIGMATSGSKRSY